MRRWAGRPAGRLAGRPAGRPAGCSAGCPAGHLCGARVVSCAEEKHLIEAAKRGRFDQMILLSAPNDMGAADDTDATDDRPTSTSLNKNLALVGDPRLR